MCRRVDRTPPAAACCETNVDVDGHSQPAVEMDVFNLRRTQTTKTVMTFHGCWFCFGSNMDQPCAYTRHRK